MPATSLTLTRGDTATLICRLTDASGLPFDPAAHSLIFTAKRALTDTDAQAVFQHTSTSGAITTRFRGGFYEALVACVPSDTTALTAAANLYADIQAQATSGGAVTTAFQGRLQIAIDVTIGTAVSVTEYTTSPAVQVIPAGGTDGQVLTKQSATDYDTDWEDPSSGAWGSITGTLANQTDLQAALDAKMDADATSFNGVAISGSGTPALSVTGTTSISGANTGDQTSVTGNAGTATALQTARNINGVAFDGSADVTVPAAGSTLTDTVPISKGGTGETSATDAFDALAGVETTNFARTTILTVPTAAALATAAGLGNLTNDAQTKAAVVPNTAPSSGQILVGNTGGTAYAKQTVGGDATLDNTGALTVTKTSGVSFGNAATKNTGTASGTVAAGDDSRITGAAQKSSNLSDLASAATAFGNIKQAATTSATGVAEQATTAEANAGIDDQRFVTPLGAYAPWTDFAHRGWVVAQNDLIEQPNGLLGTLTAGSGSVGVQVSAQNRPGVAFLRAGTGTTDRAALRSGSGVRALKIGFGAVKFQAGFALASALADATDDYRVVIGLAEGGTSSEPTAGVYFLYDRTVSVNWLAVTATSSTYTRTSTGIAVSVSSWVDGSISVNAAGTSIEFSINGSVVATNTTNIPTTSDNPAIVLAIYKVAGTTNRDLNVDYYSLAVAVAR